LKTKIYKKIIVADEHNLEKIKSIIKCKKPERLLLESSSPMFNLKTHYIARHLISGGWSESGVKLSYKGNLFKVFLSNDSPADARDAEGLLPDPKKGSESTANSRNET
jgi:hypothetical protein